MTTNLSRCSSKSRQESQFTFPFLFLLIWTISTLANHNHFFGASVSAFRGTNYFVDCCEIQTLFPVSRGRALSSPKTEAGAGQKKSRSRLKRTRGKNKGEGTAPFPKLFNFLVHLHAPSTNVLQRLLFHRLFLFDFSSPSPSLSLFLSISPFLPFISSTPIVAENTAMRAIRALRGSSPPFLRLFIFSFFSLFLFLPLLFFFFGCSSPPPLPLTEAKTIGRAVHCRQQTHVKRGEGVDEL